MSIKDQLALAELSRSQKQLRSQIQETQAEIDSDLRSLRAITSPTLALGGPPAVRTGKNLAVRTWKPFRY